jgi:hypothetical protein
MNCLRSAAILLPKDIAAGSTMAPTTKKKNKPSEVGRQLQSGLCAALSALNEIDPAALKEWLADPDFVHIDAEDRALIEHLCASLLPVTRELDVIFDAIEKAGEQLGLLAPHQFRADLAAPISRATLTLVRPIGIDDLTG